MSFIYDGTCRLAILTSDISRQHEDRRMLPTIDALTVA